jgi:hypothetical protein
VGNVAVGYALGYFVLHEASSNAQSPELRIGHSGTLLIPHVLWIRSIQIHREMPYVGFLIAGGKRNRLTATYDHSPRTWPAYIQKCRQSKFAL